MEYNNVSVVIIGTELTRGIIADKHGQLIAKEVTDLGYQVKRIIVVGDDTSLEDMLCQCLKDSDILILTGGLGPTSDDMTRAAVASLANVPLVQDDEAYAKLKARIGERINGANLRQVYFPQGFRPLENTKGTAAGFTGSIRVKRNEQEVSVLCYAMPGPPEEMHEMFYQKVLPELTALSGHTDTGRDEYSCFLVPESKLEEVCAQCARAGVLWGTRVQEYRISLYLSGGDSAERKEMARKISEKLGTGLLAYGNHEAVDIFSRYLEEHHLYVTSAESCTGGLLAKLLTDRAGSSAWFWGSVVSYANEAKKRLLGIDEHVIATHGAVSREAVVSMAVHMLEVSKADLSLAVSGIAGPTGASEDKPVGLVWFGFSSKDRPAASVSLQFGTFGRDAIRRKAAVAAFLLGFFYANGFDLLDIVSSWQYI